MHFTNSDFVDGKGKPQPGFEALRANSFFALSDPLYDLDSRTTAEIHQAKARQSWCELWHISILPATHVSTTLPSPSRGMNAPIHRVFSQDHSKTCQRNSPARLDQRPLESRVSMLTRRLAMSIMSNICEGRCYTATYVLTSYPYDISMIDSQFQKHLYCMAVLISSALYMEVISR